MSIYEGRDINGNPVFAHQGEALRGMYIKCKHCEARMHISFFPNSKTEYHLVTNQGEHHTGICSLFEGDRSAPVLRDNSPEDMVKHLMMAKPQNRKEGGNGPSGELGRRDHKEEEHKPRKLSSLRDIKQTAIYDQKPFDKTWFDSDYRFIDYVIFDKWARLIWEDHIVNIGARIVDARWVGSFSFDEKKYDAITKAMKATKEIWFSTFWKRGCEYRSVKFCIDCSSSFSDIRRKLFESGMRDNGTFCEFLPKTDDKVDALVAARWAMMNKEQCQERCPVKICKSCLGGFWGKCNSAKQVELFPANNLTKNKEKKD